MHRCIFRRNTSLKLTLLVTSFFSMGLMFGFTYKNSLLISEWGARRKTFKPRSELEAISFAVKTNSNFSASLAGKSASVDVKTRSQFPPARTRLYTDVAKSDTRIDAYNEPEANATETIPLLRWTRHTYDLMNTKERSLPSNGSDFECVFRDLDVGESDRKYHFLPFNFRRILSEPNPHPKCGCGSQLKPWFLIEKPDPEMLFVVKTAPQNAKRRWVIRNTWASIESLRGMRFATVFVVGRVGTSEEENLLRKENDLYGDMLQCNLVDTYNNLPRKVLSSIRWLLEDHIKSKYYTITDDDCVMNMLNINTYFQEINDEETMFCGFVYDEGAAPSRKMKNKWYISTECYPNARYPTFCHGGMWTVSKPLLTSLYCMSEVTELGAFHLEDVYITGILRLKLGYDDENIQPVVTESGRKFELMYYPWDESERVHAKMSLKWRLWNGTLPWGSIATVAGQPIMTSYPRKSSAEANALVEKWKRLKVMQARRVQQNTSFVTKL